MNWIELNWIELNWCPVFADAPLDSIFESLGISGETKGKIGKKASKCPYCDRFFKRNGADLQQHIWAHEGERRESYWECDFLCKVKRLTSSLDDPLKCFALLTLSTEIWVWRNVVTIFKLCLYFTQVWNPSNAQSVTTPRVARATSRHTWTGTTQKRPTCATCVGRSSNPSAVWRVTSSCTRLMVRAFSNPLDSCNNCTEAFGMFL